MKQHFVSIKNNNMKIKIGSGGHSHSCRQIANQDWDISWNYDYYPNGVNWRASKRIVRSTDEKGARKFCKKWGIEFRVRQTIESL